MRLWSVAVCLCAIAGGMFGAEVKGQEADPFVKGNWELQLSGSHLIGEEGFGDRTVDGSRLGVGAGYYFLNDVAAIAEAAGVVQHIDGESGSADAYGGGFNLLLRWHFLQIDRLSLYADGGGGFVEYDRDSPPLGTRFNFDARAGLGATFRLSERTHLMGGARFFHQSNANIEGEDRNPQVNGAEFYVGLMWML
jgi:hypothetical protein